MSTEIIMENKQAQQFQKTEYTLPDQKCSTAVRYYIQNSWIEMRRRSCYYCLALFSVLIVVLAAATSQSIIDRAPVIFLTQAEAEQGQVDIILQTNKDIIKNITDGVTPFLNFSQIQNALSSETLISSRYQLDVKVLSPKCILKFLNQFKACNLNKNSVHSQIRSAYDSCVQQDARLFVFNTAREQTMRLGRDYDKEPMKKSIFKFIQLLDECKIHKKVAAYLQLQVGDEVFFNISPQNVKQIALNVKMQDCGIDYQPCIDQYINDTGTFQSAFLKFTVQEIIEDTSGKTGLQDSIQSIFIEKAFWFEEVGEAAQLDVDMKQKIKNSNTEHYSQYVILNQKDRIDVYLDSNYDNIQLSITSLASSIARNLGIYPVQIELPILTILYQNRFTGLFLGIVLNMIIFILFILSLMLLYNLLLVSIETKNFELAVLRTLGLNKFGIISLIFIQCISYVAPGVILGILFSIGALEMVGNSLQASLGAKISNLPTSNAVAYSLVIGILIPLFSSIYPIKSALEASLSLSLDINRSKSQAVKIEIDVEGKGFPWGRISFSLICAVFGISIYYLLPLSLLSFNLALLINIFFWILIGLLLGLILIALNAQYIFERGVVYIFFFWVGSAIKSLILKNLAAHRIKNRRTAIMYSLSMAFIIFLWTALDVTIQSSQYGVMKREGTYMSVTYQGYGDDIDKREYLNVADFEQILNSPEIKSKVQSYSWVTSDFTSLFVAQGLRSVYLTHVGQIYQQQTFGIRAVSPNFLATGFTEEFLRVQERRNEDTGLDIVEELYTPRGSQSMIITEFNKEFLNVGTEEDDSILLVLYNATSTKRFRFTVNSVIVQAPIFDVMRGRQDIALSFPTIMKIAGDNIPSYEKIPMDRLMIKLADETGATADIVYNALNRYIKDNEYQINIFDYRDYIESIAATQQITDIIFSTLTFIAMVLCFFSLISSMTANILEQTKEIAVLRAVGLTNFKMVFLYIQEAFTLVFSSSIIGMIVGIIVGFTMSLQQSLFTNLPIPFRFPYVIFIVILIAAVFCSIISTWAPSRSILKHPISAIIRMTG